MVRSFIYNQFMRRSSRSSRIICACVIALGAALSHTTSTSAAVSSQQVTGLLSFTLDKREATKGETVVAAYQLNRPARKVTLTATNFDGAPVSFRFPQSIRPNAARDAGVISFTIPPEAGSLSPLLLTLNVDGQLRGLQRLIVTCEYPWFFAPRVERCPFAPVQSTPAAFQRFERGAMIWLQATDSIYVLYDAPARGIDASNDDARRLERFDDRYVEGAPEPALSIAPPDSRFLPVRGFGLVWRTAVNVRNNLGWALEPERGYTPCYGYAFGGGKSMRTYVTTPDDRLLEFDAYYAPHRWRELRTINGQPVRLTGCSR